MFLWMHLAYFNLYIDNDCKIIYLTSATREDLVQCTEHCNINERTCMPPTRISCLKARAWLCLCVHTCDTTGSQVISLVSMNALPGTTASCYNPVTRRLTDGCWEWLCPGALHNVWVFQYCPWSAKDDWWISTIGKNYHVICHSNVIGRRVNEWA